MYICKSLVALLLFLLPTRIVAPILRSIGYRIGSRVSVGFSVLFVDRLALCDGVRIGHLNFIRAQRLIMRDLSNINRSNLVNGPISLVFKKSASIGNRNKIVRSPSPSVVAWGSVFKLKDGARITSDHLIDCTRSVCLGAHSILAGSGTQVWTHGYIHATHGPSRYRIDGSVIIGNNVYIGSRCIVNPGVSIASASIVGSGAIVSKTLSKPGLYVASAIRMLPLPLPPDVRDTLYKETSLTLCEEVFVKRNSPNSI